MADYRQNVLNVITIFNTLLLILLFANEVRGKCRSAAALLTSECWTDHRILSVSAHPHIAEPKAEGWRKNQL